jgi:ketosteroid isomerase-like protein
MSQSFLNAFANAHRKAQRTFNEGDFETAFANLAPDVEWHLMPSIPETGVLEGRDAVVRYFRGIREGMDWSVQAQKFIDAGAGRVLVHQRGYAIGRTTRISDSRDFFQIWEIGSTGQAVRVREYERREDALEAAGLSE